MFVTIQRVRRRLRQSPLTSFGAHDPIGVVSEKVMKGQAVTNVTR